MTDITLHGTGNEISRRVAEFRDQLLTVTIHMESAEDHDHGGSHHLRIRDEAHLEKLLLEGLNSDPAVSVTTEFWEDLQARIDRRASGKDA